MVGGKAGGEGDGGTFGESVGGDSSTPSKTAPLPKLGTLFHGAYGAHELITRGARSTLSTLAASALRIASSHLPVEPQPHAWLDVAGDGKRTTWQPRSRGMQLAYLHKHTFSRAA